MEDWEFPATAQPKPDQLGYDLDERLSSVVSLRSEIPDDAYTAPILGTERLGNAVVIEETGLAVTIGYLVMEADSIWLTTNDGNAVPAHLVAYDYESGFGLVQALGRLGVPPVSLGRSADLQVGDQVVVAGSGGRAHALAAKVVGKRQFAGYWEYVLEEAIFTSPAHPNWGGTALLDAKGELVGIGSLYVEDARGGEQRAQGNMIVPIDLLSEIVDDLKAKGKGPWPSRPWVGAFVMEVGDKLVVAGTAPGAPAERGGLQRGDIVLEVADAPVGDLADLFRTIWALGPAGTKVPLTIWRENEMRKVVLNSADRDDYLKSPRLH